METVTIMDQERWTEVDRYITERVLPADPALEAALAASDAAGLPAIQVSPNMGKLLQLLAQSIGARKILEIGTLGGYSTIWLARAVAPSGRWSHLNLIRPLLTWRVLISHVQGSTRR